MVYMNVQEAAEKWELEERRITMLCRRGIIPGAVKENGIWLIPVNAEKPVDGRTKRGALINLRKPLPIGVSDFKEAVSHYYYVDKTDLIKDILDDLPKVSLFTRPRRFGKTLTMDMLRVFFEKSDEDTSRYFADKRIWAYGEKYTSYQGKYPVIYLSFKDVKFDTWEDTFANCTNLKNVTLPGCVNSVGSCAFNGCSNLSTVTLGANTKKIGDNAFKNCKNLKTIRR